MLSKVRVVGDSLLSGQESEFVRGAGVEWVAAAVISVLENDTETIGRFHQDLNNASLEIGEPRFATRLAANVEEDRAAGFVVRAVEEVALLEGRVRVRLIARAVREVIDLEMISRYEIDRLIVNLPADQWCVQDSDYCHWIGEQRPACDQRLHTSHEDLQHPQRQQGSSILLSNSSLLSISR